MRCQKYWYRYCLHAAESENVFGYLLEYGTWDIDIAPLPCLSTPASCVQPQPYLGGSLKTGEEK